MLHMLHLKQNSRQILALFFIIFLLLLPILSPLFHQGFFVSDDGDWMVIRLSAFYESFRDGQIPTRFLQRLNHGYGYPIANFLYPGFLYLGIPLHILGFSFIDTVKLLFGMSVVCSSYFMFLWLRKFFDDVSSVAGGVIYSYLPYHLFDIYVRGSVGEALALGVLPFVLWQIERKSVFWGSLGIGLLLVSHNTLAAFFLGFILLYAGINVLYGDGQKEKLVFYAKTVSLGAGLAAFFFIPAIFDLRHTVFSQITVSNYREYFAPILLVGLESYLIFTVTLVIFFVKKVKANHNLLTLFMLFVGLLGAFFATPLSSIFWAVLPISFVQFPFRFLALAVVSTAFLTAFVFSVFKKTERIVLGTVLSIILTFSVWSYLKNIHYTNKPETFYSTNLDTTTVQNEYMPKYVKNLKAEWLPQKVVTANGLVESVLVRNNRITFTTNATTPSTYTVQKVFFPGWVVSVDGKKTALTYDEKGLISLLIPAGRHTVSVYFAETRLGLVSDFISVASFVIVITLGILEIRKKKS